MSVDKSRRRFLKTSAAAGAAVGAATLMTPRKASAKRLKLTPAEGKVEFALEDSKKLAEVGGADKIKIEGHEKVVVVRKGEEEFHTLSLKCTHEGCNVKWKKDETLLKCPCHESSFQLSDGVSTGGPAKDPLLVYPTEFKDGKVIITVPDDAPKAEDKKKEKKEE